MYEIVLFAAAAAVGQDAVLACRQAHAGDAAAHIACLERALGAHAAAPAPAAANVAELGAEHLRAAERRNSDAPAPQATVEIVATTYTQGGRGVFEMADGQVWRETEAAPVRQRLEPTRRYSARIERGVLGGYRMYVEGVTRMIKLERIK